MNKPSIDWGAPVLPALWLALMFLTAYGGDWIHALAYLGIAYMDQYLKGEKEKALPRESYLVDPLPKLR